MAVAVVLEFRGATLDQYDQLVEKMGFSPGGAGAPGGLFHWVTQTDGGIRVTVFHSVQAVGHSVPSVAARTFRIGRSVSPR